MRRAPLRGGASVLLYIPFFLMIIPVRGIVILADIIIPFWIIIIILIFPFSLFYTL